MATDYGTDIACIDDADARWRTCSGIRLVLQDVYHRYTTKSVLGRILNPDGTVEPNPAAENYGDDVRLYVGSKQSDESAAALGPHLSEVAQRSARVETADATVTREDAGNGNCNLRIVVKGTSAAGPFDFVFLATSTELRILSGGTP